jgi:acyl-CoA thioesterase FadM
LPGIGVSEVRKLGGFYRERSVSGRYCTIESDYDPIMFKTLCDLLRGISRGDTLRLMAAAVMGYTAASYLPDMAYRIRFRAIDYIVDELKMEEKEESSYEDTMHCMVNPCDIDRNGHMNNARFLRELNFSRRTYFFKYGLWPIVKKQQRNFFVVAQTIRYRRELRVWDKYVIRTKIIGCSDAQDCFFVESRFENRDKFVNAIHYCKYKLVGDKKKDSNSSVDEIKPSELLTKVGIVGVANVDTKGNSRFLDSWDEANAISSRELNPRLSKNEV